MPVPGGVLREAYDADERRPHATSRARSSAPAFTAEQYQNYAAGAPALSWLAGIPELRNATWIDLPTSHWPMWSRPRELAEIIGDVAKAVAPGA